MNVWELIQKEVDRPQAAPPGSLAPELTTADLAEALLTARRVGAAARAVAKRIESALGDDLGPGGWFVYGGTLFRFRHKYRNDVVDEDLFWEWLKADVPADKLQYLFNADSVKVTGLRAIAPEEVLNTFVLQREYSDELRLESIPKSRWPKWARDFADGDRGMRPIKGPPS